VSGTAIQIQRRADGVFVEATLLDGVAPPDLLVVEAEWVSERSLVLQELLSAGVPRPKWPQSLGWDWRRKAPQLKLLESAGFGVVSEQQWQGLMLTKSASHVSYLGADKGKPLIYIDFLEIAPWNWPIPEISRSGKFRGIGSTLFWSAVAQSDREGFHGRVTACSFRRGQVRRAVDHFPTLPQIPTLLPNAAKGTLLAPTFTKS